MQGQTATADAAGSVVSVSRRPGHTVTSIKKDALRVYLLVKCESAKFLWKPQSEPKVLSLSSKTDISYVRVIMARIVKSLHAQNEKRLKARAYAVTDRTQLAR